MADIFPVTADIKEYFRQTYIQNDQEGVQRLLSSLRDKGCSQMQTVFLLYNEAKLSFQDANNIVQNSDAWR